MNEFNHLESVKSALGITGTYQDATLTQYINEVKLYLSDAGISEAVLNSSLSVGVISRGVSDLWNYGAGRLSEYFYQRANQLSFLESSGKVIAFHEGDYGSSYPINIEGLDIKVTDEVVFSCADVTKKYHDESDNCILVTFTQAESELFSKGTYNWSLQIIRDTALITLVRDGILIVW